MLGIDWLCGKKIIFPTSMELNFYLPKKLGSVICLMCNDHIAFSTKLSLCCNICMSCMHFVQLLPLKWNFQVARFFQLKGRKKQISVQSYCLLSIVSCSIPQTILTSWLYFNSSFRIVFADALNILLNDQLKPAKDPACWVCDVLLVLCTNLHTSLCSNMLSTPAVLVSPMLFCLLL